MTDSPYQPPLPLPASDEYPVPPQSSLRHWFLALGATASIIAILIAMLLPVRRTARASSKRMECATNLTQLAQAMRDFHDVYGHFPPAFTVDANGNRLHSWRTLLLPYLDQIDLYKTIDLKKPWNHPANSRAFKADLSVFQCPATDAGKGKTTYQAVVAPDALFPTDGTYRTLDDITDGASQTLMLVEVSPNAAVHWMNPNDGGAHDFLRTLSQDSETAHAGSIHAALADGSVRFLRDTTSHDRLSAMTTINANDQQSEH